MNQSKSQQLFDQAQRYIPGGVNSPVRSFRAVSGTPPFIARGQGSRVWDVDGNEYIDYLGSWGPLVLGHAHPAVVEALKQAAEGGPALARRWSWRWNWPEPFARRCPRWTACGWSVPAPRPA